MEDSDNSWLKLNDLIKRCIENMPYYYSSFELYLVALKGEMRIDESSVPWGLLRLVGKSGLLNNAVFKYCVDQGFYQSVLERLLAYFRSVQVVVFLFEYLIGYVQRGVWATYSDTSWEFRATYVSIELRLAAYFWFKFRAWPAQPSSPDRGCKRSRVEKGTPSVYLNDRNKFEPKLKALRTGEKRMRDVWLRDYDTRQEAEDVYCIGAFYYGRWDRFSGDLSWYNNNLPQIPPNQSDKEKAEWVREQAKNYLTRSKHQGGVAAEQCQGGVAAEQCQGGVAAEQCQGGVAAEQCQGGFAGEQCQGGVAAEQCQGGVAAEQCQGGFAGEQCQGGVAAEQFQGGVADTQFMLQEIMTGPGLFQEDSTGIGLGQCESGDITIDDYIVGAYSRQGEVSGQGVGSEGLNSLRTCQDQSTCHQQDVQHLQPSHGSAIDLGCGGAVGEVGTILRQDETEEHGPVLRASANHMQAVDLPNVAQELEELEFTDTIRSTFRELCERGWDWKIQPRVSTKFSVAFSRCEVQDRPEITATNYSAFRELHEQGCKITLVPISNASPQDGNGRPQSLSASRDLCRSCNARQAVE